MTKSNSELRRMAAKRLASRLVRDHLGQPVKKPSAEADTAEADTANAERERTESTQSESGQPAGVRPAGVRPASSQAAAPEGDPIICVVHGRQTARKIVSRALAGKLDAAVHRYGSCEDALRYTEHYNTFVVYNNFGKRMNGARGVERIRTAKPGALIIGVTSVPGFRKEFRAAGANDTVLLSGNEVGELASKISRFHAGAQSSAGGR